MRRSSCPLQASPSFPPGRLGVEEEASSFSVPPILKMSRSQESLLPLLNRLLPFLLLLLSPDPNCGGNSLFFPSFTKSMTVRDTFSPFFSSPPPSPEAD